MLTLSEILNKGYQAIMKQGKPCRSNSGRCHYYYGGKKCIWGHVLGEHAQEMQMIAQEVNITGLSDKDDSDCPVNSFSREKLGPMEPGWAELGCAMQHIHDTIDPIFWPKKFHNLASEYSIKLEEIV